MDKQRLDRGSEIGCVVITGGTGSFGSAFARFLLAETDGSIRIYSRDEHRQEMLARELELEFGIEARRVTFILGDVRDEARLAIACARADAIVHAAALKSVPMGQRHLDEFVKTNIGGTLNVLVAARDEGLQKALLISSDKAVAALNAYGKTKAVAEELFVQANQWGTACAVVRGGNVWGSNGSVVAHWQQARAAGRPLEVTGPEATRFHLPMDGWVHYCWRALNGMHGGEIFVPKLWAWRLGDLAAAFDGATAQCVGARDGDKPLEYLIDPLEGPRVKDIGWSYVVEPGVDLRAVWNYQEWRGTTLPAGWVYDSSSAPRLGVADLRELLK